VTRRYDVVVDVRRGIPGRAVLQDDAPAAFVWRGRLYSVQAVLAHWMETGAWWGRATPDSGGALDDREREIWRVQAGPGRDASSGGSVGVFDLCFDWSAGGWTLARAHD
jgi:Family of unknown function (DUF6504)